ncbi:MAG: hypothetical protein LBK04_04030 [Clostridiales Family XIII bacterium]|jgi:hypothetical protein|nr:hypothetical protein [Clostridiales Family XIII bacterium]
MYDTDLDRCLICDTEPADVYFKGQVICEDCLQAVKVYYQSSTTVSVDKAPGIERHNA